MRLVRTDWTDWFRDVDESVVLVDDRVVVVSELATCLLVAVGTDGATLRELEAALVERFGAPEGIDPAAATEAATRDLVESGVLERVGE